jgi:hypothetical protein
MNQPPAELQGFLPPNFVAESIATMVREEAVKTSAVQATSAPDAVRKEDPQLTGITVPAEENTSESNNKASKLSEDAQESILDGAAKPLREGLSEEKEQATRVSVDMTVSAESPPPSQDETLQLLSEGAKVLKQKFESGQPSQELAKQIEFVNLAMAANGKLAAIMRKDALVILQKNNAAETGPAVEKMQDELSIAYTQLELELIDKTKLDKNGIMKIIGDVKKDGISALIQLWRGHKLPELLADELSLNIFGQELTPQQLEGIASKIGIKETGDWKKKGKQGLLLLLAFIIGVGAEEFNDNMSINSLMGSRSSY